MNTDQYYKEFNHVTLKDFKMMSMDLQVVYDGYLNATPFSMVKLHELMTRSYTSCYFPTNVFKSPNYIMTSSHYINEYVKHINAARHYACSLIYDLPIGMKCSLEYFHDIDTATNSLNSDIINQYRIQKKHAHEYYILSGQRE